jgi:hypothetical protein
MYNCSGGAVMKLPAMSMDAVAATAQVMFSVISRVSVAESVKSAFCK